MTRPERDKFFAQGYAKLGSIRTSSPELYTKTSLNGVTQVEVAKFTLRQVGSELVATELNTGGVAT